jgi:hypothetical protein
MSVQQVEFGMQRSAGQLLERAGCNEMLTLSLGVVIDESDSFGLVSDHSEWSRWRAR